MSKCPSGITLPCDNSSLYSKVENSNDFELTYMMHKYRPLQIVADNRMQKRLSLVTAFNKGLMHLQFLLV